MSSDIETSSPPSTPPPPRFSPPKPPIPPKNTHGTHANSKEKTIEALNIIYGRKLNPNDPVHETRDKDADKDESMKIHRSTPIKIIQEAIKNIQTSSSIPILGTTATEEQGVWFNMTDEYPVDNFTGREEILQKINDQVLDLVKMNCKSRDMRPISRAIVLTGGAGIGKTEIARKYAFKFYVDFNGHCNLIWINGETPKTIRDSFLRLAETEFSSSEGGLTSPHNFHNLRRSTSQKQFNLVRSKPIESLNDSDSNSEYGIDDSSSPSSPKNNSPPKSPSRPKSMIVQPIKMTSSLPPPPSKSKLSPQKLAKLQEELLTEEEEKIEGILRNKIFQEFPTLFIFDNAHGEQDIVNYLPKLSPVGHIPSVLVTSSYEHHWNNSRVFKVLPFEILEAVDFLLGFQDIAEFTGNQAHALAKELHYFPPLLQRARKIVANHLANGCSGEKAILRLEKNVALVRRLKGNVIQHKEVEIALLSVDRGNFVDEDAYVRQHDGELRTHPLAMRLYQLEALIPIIQNKKELSILTVNEPDAYVIATLAHMAGPKAKILNIYETESWTEISMGLLIKSLNKDNPNLLKNSRVELRLETIAKGKAAKRSKISLALEKIRARDTTKKQYDIVLTNVFDDIDLSVVRKLLQIGGRFVTSMSSSNVSQILKKNDPKKLEIKVLKQDFPELLVIVQRIL